VVDIFLNSYILDANMKYAEELVSAVIQKSELKQINREFVSEQIIDYIQRHPKVNSKLETSQTFDKFILSKEYTEIIKAIRANLRKPYGVFQIDAKKREALLDSLSKTPGDIDIHQKILATHRSSKERLEIYPKLYTELFDLTGKPKSILDIGCGLNPISYPWMQISAEYIATELSQLDVDFISRYFKIKKIKNKTFVLNLLENYNKLAQFDVDICFMFKLLDSLEATRHNISEKIIPHINAKHLVVSFSTKTISGKQMRSGRRTWFENLVSRLGFKFKLLEYPNEIFYVLKK
jgi:2-polyprenyl-3-methyl-5-hydroxy-6-metoxy-1,4-benzoquinol methylase